MLLRDLAACLTAAAVFWHCQRAKDRMYAFGAASTFATSATVARHLSTYEYDDAGAAADDGNNETAARSVWLGERFELFASRRDDDSSDAPTARRARGRSSSDAPTARGRSHAGHIAARSSRLADRTALSDFSCGRQEREHKDDIDKGRRPRTRIVSQVCLGATAVPDEDPTKTDLRDVTWPWPCYVRKSQLSTFVMESNLDWCRRGGSCGGTRAKRMAHYFVVDRAGRNATRWIATSAQHTSPSVSQVMMRKPKEKTAWPRRVWAFAGEGAEDKALMSRAEFFEQYHFDLAGEAAEWPLWSRHILQLAIEDNPYNSSLDLIKANALNVTNPALSREKDGVWQLSTDDRELIVIPELWEDSTDHSSGPLIHVASPANFSLLMQGDSPADEVDAVLLSFGVSGMGFNNKQEPKSHDQRYTVQILVNGKPLTPPSVKKLRLVDPPPSCLRYNEIVDPAVERGYQHELKSNAEAAWECATADYGEDYFDDVQLVSRWLRREPGSHWVEIRVFDGTGEQRAMERLYFEVAPSGSAKDIWSLPSARGRVAGMASKHLRNYAWRATPLVAAMWDVADKDLALLGTPGATELRRILGSEAGIRYLLLLRDGVGNTMTSMVKLRDAHAVKRALAVYSLKLDPGADLFERPRSP